MKRQPAILVLLCATLSASADPPAAVEPSAEKLIRDLTAADWAQRQQAEDALVLIGMPAVSAINAALAGSTDFEQRDRLQSALARIGREQLLTATRVTIKRRFDRPADAFEALAKAVGVAVEFDGPAAEARAREQADIDLDLNDRPWLESLTETIARSNVNARLDDGRILLLSAPPQAIRRPTHIAGAVSVSADNARRRLATDLATGNTTASLLVRLAAMCEPKVKFKHTSARLVVHKMLDQDGGSILGDAQRAVQLQRESAGRYLCTLSFNAAHNPPSAISLIEGEIVGEVVTRITEARIDDLAALPQTLETPAGPVEVVSLTRSGRSWSLVIQFNRDTNLQQTLSNDLSADSRDGLRILDQNGQAMQAHLSGQNMNQASIDATLTITTSRAESQPASLVWGLASQTRDVRIPFALRDLPLPR